jgi:phenylacetate-CoA ligase
MNLVTGLPNPLGKPYWRLRLKFGDTGDRLPFRELETHQWLSPQQVQELQWNKLKALLAHAYEHVPYYRQLFDEHGIEPAGIQTPDDYLCVPLLTKEIMQAHQSSLVARNISRDQLLENHTGGSTGQPLTFYQDLSYRRYASAGLAWGFHMCGFRPGARQAFMWGSDYDSTAHKGWQNQLRDWFKNVLWINVFDLTESSLVKAARLLSRWKPDFMWGYTSSIEMLAKTVRKYQIRGIQPQAIQLTAEVVTQVQRQLVEETFGCRVFNRYGCREVSLVAHECSMHSGLHLLADNNYVEFLQDARPVSAGQEGSLIITNLNNYAMPLLRYEIGDTGIPAQTPCECGRGYPLMAMAQGRLVDIIVSPSGKLLHGEFFTHLFYKTQGIRQFQVIQETPQDLCVKIVPGDGFSPATLQFLEQAIHDHADRDFVVHFELCDQIPLSASGKYRFTMSRISAS